MVAGRNDGNTRAATVEREREACRILEEEGVRCYDLVTLVGLGHWA